MIKNTSRAPVFAGLLAVSLIVVAACTSAASPAASSGPGASAAAPGPTGAATGETTLQRLKRTGVALVGFTNEAPFSIAQPDKVTGIDPEIMRAFLATQGVKTEQGTLMEFSSLIPSLLASRIDVITAGLWISKERCQSIAFSNPTTQITQAFAVKKGNPKNLHSYKDVATSGAIFGANTGGLEFTWADAAGIKADKQVQFPDLQTGIAALQAGRVDAISNNELAIADYLKKLNDPNLELATLTEQPADKNGVSSLAYSSFGFRQADTDFVDAFNKWIADSKADGSLLKLISPFGITADMIPPADKTAASLCGG